MPFTETQLRLGRLKAEAHLIAAKYGVNVNYDRTDGTWLHVARLPIPQGWNHPTVDILIDIAHGSPSYPQAAPDWFWTNRDLMTSDGRSINHFFSNAQQDRKYWDKGFGHFCIHLQNWRPVQGPGFERGDNLLTYLGVIMQVFHDRKKLTR